MNVSLLLHQIVLWVNSVAILVFLGMEIFWHVKQKKRVLVNILSLFGGFLIFNLPFLLLAASMAFQPLHEEWAEGLRLIFLVIGVPVNLWLHYHGDKGGNSIGMFSIFFLLVAVPSILIIEVLIALL